MLILPPGAIIHQDILIIISGNILISYAVTGVRQQSWMAMKLQMNLKILRMIFIFILGWDAEMLPKYMSPGIMISFRFYHHSKNIITSLIITNTKIITIITLPCIY